MSDLERDLRRLAQGWAAKAETLECSIDTAHLCQDHGADLLTIVNEHFGAPTPRVPVASRTLDDEWAEGGDPRDAW